MRVLNEFVKKKEVKKTRPRLKQADRVPEYLQFVDFEPNHLAYAQSRHTMPIMLQLTMINILQFTRN